jgi:hypothetical protein
MCGGLSDFTVAMGKHLVDAEARTTTEIIDQSPHSWGFVLAFGRAVGLRFWLFRHV